MYQASENRSDGVPGVDGGWNADLYRIKKKMIKIVHASIVIGVIVIMGITSLL